MTKHGTVHAALRAVDTKGDGSLSRDEIRDMMNRYRLLKHVDYYTGALHGDITMAVADTLIDFVDDARLTIRDLYEMCWDEQYKQQYFYISARLEKIRNIRREIQAAFKANDLHQLTVRNLASLLSKLNALRGAVVSAQLHLWPFHHLMKDALAKARWVDCTALDPPVVEEMWWWHDQMKDWSGKSVIPTRSQMVVTTDASSHGWGGWWRHFGQTGTPRNEARGF